MAPVEFEPRESGNGDTATEPPTPPSLVAESQEADPVTAPETETTTDVASQPSTTPAPTNVDAYKPRGIRGNKYSPLAITHLVLRFLTCVFALIAFAVIASTSDNVGISTFSGYVVDDVQFSDLFYFSYLLTANVLAFTYALATLVFALVLLSRGKVYEDAHFLLGLLALDQIISYLLMSASTSAATGIRAQKDDLKSLGISSDFFSSSYAAITFSFLAFFALAAVTVISGYRLLRRGRGL